MSAKNDAPSPGQPLASHGIYALSPFYWLLFMAAINLLGPFLPIPNAVAALLGGVALTLVYVAVVIAFALGIAHRRLSIVSALIWLGVSVLVWLAIEYGLLPWVREELRGVARRDATPAQHLLKVGTETLQDLALFGAANCAGTLLARLIRHANMMGPIGAAIALIDIWGVLFGGIVSQMMTSKSTQPIAEKAMAAGPTLGTASAQGTGFSIAFPDIGVGDFLFIALLLSVLVNLAMKWRESARLMWVLVCFALLSLQLLPLPPLPGLLFIGAAAVLPNWKFFKFTREEQFALLYAAIFVVILTSGLYFGFKSLISPNDLVPKR